MQFDDKLVKQISETKYLSQENSYRYRPIMRYFYSEYEKTKYWLYKEDVYEALKEYTVFEEYTLADCERDLEVLVEWQSLTKMQDTSNVSTLKEFRDRKFRYQITDYAIEIEHLTIELENLEVKTSSLEPKLFERIKNKLKQMENLRQMTPTDINELWHDLNNDFTALNQNYQAFLKKFNEAKTEELLQSVVFLEFKSEMIRYLRDFIQSYQSNVYHIRRSLKNISEENVQFLMNTLINYEKKAPKMRPAFDFNHLRDVNVGKWNNIYQWFLGGESSSEGDRLMTTTNNIIVKITKYASSLVELRGNMTSRKEEYKYICKLFDKQQSIEDAHKLSSIVFGIGTVKHFVGYANVTTDSIVPTYHLPPIEIPLEIRNRLRKEKTYITPIIDKTWQKEKVMKEEEQKREENKKILQHLIQDKKIDLKGELNLSLVERRYILNLLSKKNHKKDTEFGYSYQVIPYHDHSTCVIHSEDGNFEMESVLIRFEDDVNE